MCIRDRKKATDGTVRLEVFYDGTMGNERDVIEGVSMGTIEMYAGSTAPLANFVDDFNIWDLPYMVDMNKLEDAYAIMDGAIGQKMLDSVSSIGTKMCIRDRYWNAAWSAVCCSGVVQKTEGV